jgi:hypothetical protein
MFTVPKEAARVPEVVRCRLPAGAGCAEARPRTLPLARHPAAISCSERAIDLSRRVSSARDDRSHVGLASCCDGLRLPLRAARVSA